MAQHIDRKLKLTSAVLGVVARKDLAAAFRRINPNTSFDVGRADKWLHGRAQPREMQLYEDWAKVLGLDQSGRWVADCDIEAFIGALCARHGRDAAELRQHLEASTGRATREGPSESLAGTFVCYSHAWSPYFRGRLIRGELSVAQGRPERTAASYAEVLPTGRLQLDGTLAADKRTLRLEVCDATRTSQYVNFSLFPPSPPISVMGGLMFGTTLIGPDAQPSMSRAVLIRLPSVHPRLRSEEAYLPSGASISRDLEALGLPIDDPMEVDLCLAAFLNNSGRDGVDQVPTSAYRALVDQFDRIWLACMRGDVPDRGGTVRRFPSRGVRTRR